MTIPLLNVSPPATPAASTSAPSSNFWGDDGAFKNMLDIINPLQHIPIVSTIYQSLTGDTESTGAKLAGGALYGGGIGLAAAIANEIVQTQTGKDVGGHVAALVTGGDGSVQVAQNDSGSYLSPNQRAAYNAYVKTQNMVG